MNPIFADLPTTIFEEMSVLARSHDAINLGQGFPDDPGPEDVRRKAADAVMDGNNQYPSMMGIPELRAAIAAHYAAHQGLTLDPNTEVMVTSGATEAIAGALFALLSPGDEVVIFEPAYDAYGPLIRRAGGVVRAVKLQPPHWKMTEAAIRAALSPRTRVVLLNNPLNPAGVVYGVDDLAILAKALEGNDAVVVSDEVWEHVVFDGLRHVSVLNVPGLRDRAVKIGSAGKIFCLTGWKVGFVAAAPHLLKALAKAHQFLTFTTPPNLQSAAAYGLGKDMAYFTGMRASFQRSRDRLAAGLTGLGYRVLPSEATYFLSIDLAASGIAMGDVAFCEWLLDEAGVAAIPVSAFYAQDAVTNVVRLCFAKADDTIDSALERMARRP